MQTGVLALARVEGRHHREPMSVERIQRHFRESAALKLDALDALSMPIAAAIDTLFGVLANGNKILACGNGASATDAQRFAAQLIACFERERPGLPAIALTADATVLTALGDNGSFEEVFAKQVRALGHSGDVLFAESDPVQAEIIQRRSGRPVLCPVLGKVLQPSVAEPDWLSPEKKAEPVHTPTQPAKRGCTSCGGNKPRVVRGPRGRL